MLLNRYGAPFSEKSLTGMMGHWCRQAGVPVAINRKKGTHGCTLHGLRKNLGIILALDGATAPHIMNAMGNNSVAKPILIYRWRVASGWWPILLLAASDLRLLPSSARR